MAKNSLKELEGDLKYLTHIKPQQSILCPTCGVEHENGFSVRLELIDDASQLRSIISDLEQDLRKTNESQAENIDKLDVLRVKSNHIQELLQSKKGELRLQDVIESQSASVIHTAFTNDIDAIQSRLNAQESDVGLNKEKLEKFDLPERTKEINDYYSERMELFLSELEVADTREDLKKKPDAPFVSSGSAIPRTILAYQFAVLHTAKEKGDAKLFPIVIDSPNQQGQDKDHLSQMLSFVLKRVPAGQQLILAVEEDPNLSFEGSTILLDKPFAVLDPDYYDTALSELKDLVQEVMGQIDLSLEGILASKENDVI